MSNTNARVSVMVSHTRSNKSSGHSDPMDNASGRRISHHGNPTDSAITSGAGKPKTVYVGKNQYPISIVQLDEVSDIAWRKKAGLDLLTSLLGSLSGGHNMLDLITLVDNNVTMDT